MPCKGSAVRAIFDRLERAKSPTAAVATTAVGHRVVPGEWSCVLLEIQPNCEAFLSQNYAKNPK